MVLTRLAVTVEVEPECAVEDGDVKLDWVCVVVDEEIFLREIL